MCVCINLTFPKQKGQKMTLCPLSYSHKDVAEANFALHETHCSRFLCLCPDCNEAVPKDQLSQHKEEQHTQVHILYTHTEALHVSVFSAGLTPCLFTGEMLRVQPEDGTLPPSGSSGESRGSFVTHGKTDKPIKGDI